MAALLLSSSESNGGGGGISKVPMAIDVGLLFDFLLAVNGSG